MKYSQVKISKQTFRKETDRFSNKFLDLLYRDTLYLKAFVRNASYLIKGVDVPAKLDTLMKDRARSRALFADFMDDQGGWKNA